MEQKESRIKGIIHTGLVVSNMKEALSFYQGLLGFEIVSDLGTVSVPEFEALSGVPGTEVKIITLKEGEGTFLELFEYVHPVGLSRPELHHYDIGFTHIALEVSGIEAVYQRLKDCGIKFITPIRYYPDLKYAYLRGPDNVFLELTEFN
jgi:catechol 2,3-dioxygenase-like lactoylglutathione lyase family enzyme